MSEAMHTKGPWQQDGSHIYGCDPQRTPICQIIYPGRGYQEEAAANESVIKAAPDLLAALKEARVWMIHGTRQTPEERGAKCETAYDAETLIDAAIAKAEGRE